MKVGFIGVGLIGGSILKRLAKCGVECFIFDTNKAVLDTAMSENNAKLLSENDKLDVLILALTPKACLQFIEKNHSKIGTTLIVDVCGVKKCISDLANTFNLNYCGLHPMAGREVGGYFNSKENLFSGANVVVTSKNPPQIVYEIIHLLGFGKVVYSTPDEHDKIVSYTSQLCHIVSNAYAKNPCSDLCDGFTGGSYEDLTRVGKMDSNLWVDLFLKNKENLFCDINIIINELSRFATCLKDGNADELKNLIEEGNYILSDKKML